MRHILLILGFLFTCISINAQSFLSTNEQDIVNENGEPIILRGMGLGGWMVQEGYMLQTASFASPQHQIRAKIQELIGEASTEEFYDAWLENHVTKTDIDSLKSWGFNSVRLPMHYNLYTLPIEDEPVAGQHTWLDRGFEMTDKLIEWCADNEMYVVLDMHACPGGQGYDEGISDYDPNKPSLWESGENKAKLVALWKRLAERYKDEPWVAGYDLINEPNWDLPGGAALRGIYNQITAAIREVDTRHIIFIEGNWFANDFTGLTPPWDDNLVYSPHKYWSINDQESIQWVLNLRNQHNVPLYLGESGENSNVWFRDAIKLFEDNNIGWAWWPMKKVEAVAGPLSATKNSGYETLLNYWNNGGTQPTASFAKAALMELANNFKMENCYFQKDVIDAMIRQPYSDETRPYKTQEIPGRVFATDYDMGRNGVAYFDTGLATYHVSTGNFTAWNNGWAYRNDGVDIERSSDSQSNGFNVGWIDDGEWMQYDVNVNSTAVYDIKIRTASQGGGGNFYFSMDGADITTPYYVANSGGWQTWNDLTFSDVVLDESMKKLRFHANEGGFNLSSFEFIEKGPTTDIETKFLSAVTLDQNSIQLNINKLLDTSSTPNPTDFEIFSNGSMVSITSATLHPDNNRVIIFDVDDSFSSSDVLKISYTGNTIDATDGTALSTFNLKNVLNNISIIHSIPGTIEAEEYFFQSGVDTENTFDTGGGKNIGNLDAGDYLDYNIWVNKSGTFNVDYRTAAASEEGQVKLWFFKEGDNLELLQTANFDPTGDWQTWETTEDTPIFYLPAGRYQFRLEISKPSFNLNWFRFNQLSTTSNEEVSLVEDIKIFPNPSNGLFSIEANLKEKQNITLNIHNLLGQVVLSKKLNQIERIQESIDLMNSPIGNYFISIQLENGKTINEKILYVK